MYKKDTVYEDLRISISFNDVAEPCLSTEIDNVISLEVEPFLRDFEKVRERP
ncbi:unnamed protein product [Paramecium octaurelia]|uniref:Uncharacterized protein n=1 Tax=Paramecium octaurelia TaxID=43137 RepID=A0A8S1VU86_PAROT|nr:unnamed protein product [Paramecium octaurelia]